MALGVSVRYSWRMAKSVRTAQKGDVMYLLLDDVARQQACGMPETCA